MERSYGREFQAMSGAPVKKLPASPRVGSTSVPVTDRGSEEVNVGFSDFGAGRSNQLRDPRARRSAVTIENSALEISSIWVPYHST
jgi:hypothetical protein